MNLSRVLLAGVASGSGKTTATCAILQALRRRGLRLHAFKCGPDYVDPLFHQKIIGIRGSNLDLFFHDADTLNGLLASHGAGIDLAIMEGVMGYYDGTSMQGSDHSSHAIAKATNTPAVLVVSARGMAWSVVALLQGFLQAVPDSGIRGVILNQVGASAYCQLKKAIHAAFGDSLAVLGYLPPMPENAFDSRQLGLVNADEIREIHQKLDRLAKQAEESLDLEGLLRLAAAAPAMNPPPLYSPVKGTPVRIAVAQDLAFCFYYRDNLNLLTQLGAELIPFSPLTDAGLPPCDALYLGGGYPELHLEALSGNTGMRQSILDALASGLPCLAEGGGFIYLTQSLEGRPMVGYLPGDCINTGRLTRFGYVTLTAGQNNMLCRKGSVTRGHEFHYCDCTDNGHAFTARKISGASWPCVHATDTLYAGFPHLSFHANPAFAQCFINAALRHQYKKENNT